MINKIAGIKIKYNNELFNNNIEHEIIIKKTKKCLREINIFLVNKIVFALQKP